LRNAGLVDDAGDDAGDYDGDDDDDDDDGYKEDKAMNVLQLISVAILSNMKLERRADSMSQPDQ
jgi:hypothetical protein